MSGAGTTIVTQTHPAPEHEEAFGAWQKETSRLIAGFAGFVRQTVIPPSPPTQVDWLILQNFTDRESALAWLRSDVRLSRAKDVRALVVGDDDIHIVSGDGSHATDAPVSAVISTRVKPGQEADYRRWEQQISALQAQQPGFEGYRLEPPIPGVQDDWLAIVRFDKEDSLKLWLDSPARHELLKQADAFTAEFHTRIARTGFDQWFDVSKGGVAGAAAWKQNMIVLLLLYPIVFLFGALVGTPWLMGRWGIAFPITLFISNVVSTCLLNYAVPWTSQRFKWWLQPKAAKGPQIRIAGTAILVVLYGLLILAFCTLF
jgi:antibiotic biosynthesis monooxygenase (ABM) superfamily enzyme